MSQKDLTGEQADMQKSKVDGEPREFLVHGHGQVMVEAEDKKEAKDKAWERTHDMDIMDVEVEDIYSESDFFKAKLVRTGSTKSSSTFKPVTSKSALELLYRINRMAARSFVGENHQHELMAEAAVHILAQHKDIDFEELEEDIKKLGEKYDEKGIKETLQEKFAIEE